VPAWRGPTMRIAGAYPTCSSPAIRARRASFDAPRAIFEVLSPSTEREDRSEKLDFYRSFASVDAVVLVWQDTRRVELHLREEDAWRVRDIIGTGLVVVPSLAIEMSLDEIYAE